jgi:predicted ATPase
VIRRAAAVLRYNSDMGVRNSLIEGVSGGGKTSVSKELQRRGYHAINGDTDLAYQGDSDTGESFDGFAHEHHIWHVGKVRALVTNQDEALTFFCGGSRICRASLTCSSACLSLKSTLTR